MKAKKIKLFYIPIDKIIVNGFTKTLTSIKFYTFIKQMRIT